MAEYQRNKNIITSNIREFERRAAVAQEQKRISVQMLTSLIWDNVAEEGTDAVWRELGEVLGSTSLEDKGNICIAICDSLGEDGLARINLFDSARAVSPMASGRVAYVHNKRSDDAFLAFGKKVFNPKADYVSGFSDACEAVMDGRSEFCILPLENNTEGRLYSFYALLDRYDLKICHKTDISNEDGTDTVGFALVGRAVGEGFDRDERVRFEFSVVDEDTDFISRVLGVAEALGGKVYSIGTQPVLYDEGSCRCYFSVDMRAHMATAMALYMSIEHSGYAPLGLYKIQKGEEKWKR